MNNNSSSVIMMDEMALVLVCKRPVLGVGKQRLANSLGMERAQQIAQALLACALEDAENWNGLVVIAPASEEDHDWATTLLPSSMAVWIQPQTIGNLGQRLNELDSKLRYEGLKQLVYIGSDAPILAHTDYATCRAALQHHDTVLIPATDGGVVLMASCTPWPVLADLPWSTDQLGAALMSCCRCNGQSVAVLEQRSDVDELEDCLELITLLQHDARPARRQLHALACAIAYTLKIHHVQF
ncbi:DUF2064 domain-containing protein [Nitrosomonas sp. Is37]|uniref:TIGR04282 family arsenosugar biosynthesis glycosyltransferase n=1 Tax=Nitrosomonas sp. Is37 TaxID=3080535 RepID=UPI00294B94A9|nr:DUF2064 domain-containing protein [Nitrosomonas sp. Is37]MDV6345388.1 DUF2064 domain-containing protein [Nitrosomonas sp. Is37]